MRRGDRGARARPGEGSAGTRTASIPFRRAREGRWVPRPSPGAAPDSGPLLVPLALLAPALSSPTGPARERRAIGTALLLLGLAYAGVYVLTPKPLAWHLSSSLHRLLIHVYPLLVLAAVVWRGRLRWVPRPRGA